MKELSINTDLARKILTGFIRDEIRRAGFNRALLGLSGGVDSALSCYLAAEALGPHNVLAVRMPYTSSNQSSFDDAQRVIDAAGVQSITYPITQIVQPLLDVIPLEENVRRGNVMARARMLVLYDFSAASKSLVLGTSNKTEILLGYSTQWGDSAAALNPLGDLYKCQVRQLAAAVGVPDSILRKAPSADLWPGQTDESELGFNYDDADRLLFRLVDKRFSLEDCFAEGFDEKFVNKVMARIQKNHYKRIMPPIAKLSNRTFGYDFLYLRDWGT
ncbi:MAG: NAD+ synthase [Anaerolineae bacterium]|nr:MAG: NAD+ synthase [Anaerolineae bacterium]